MKQLKLTPKELTSIGFTKEISDSDEMNHSRVFFKIKTTNGYFYYNHNEDVYTWYHKTIIGEMSNHNLLDITSKAELFVLLRCFKVKFNMIIK